MDKYDRIEREAFIERRRRAHHIALASLAVVRLPNADDGCRIWRALRRVEIQTHTIAIAYCNRGASDVEIRTVESMAHREVERILGHIPAGFTINWDPRGYTLKIDSEKAPIPDGMERDMGGYGILAPLIG